MSLVLAPSTTEHLGCLQNGRYTRQAGFHSQVVSERLGHASIGITFGTYSHVMPGMQEEAAEKIKAGLRAALAG
jgi:integrase